MNRLYCKAAGESEAEWKGREDRDADQAQMETNERELYGEVTRL